MSPLAEKKVIEEGSWPSQSVGWPIGEINEKGNCTPIS